MEQFGNKYGGYKVLVDQMLPLLTLWFLSFGIGEDLSFSQDMIDKIGAEVYAFDPTPRSLTYVQGHKLYKNEKFHFYPIGLSDKDQQQTFYFPKEKEYVSCSIHKQDWVGDEAYTVDMNCF